MCSTTWTTLPYRPGADWAAWYLPGGPVDRQPGGPPHQMLQEGVERRREGPLVRERKFSLNKLFAGLRVPGNVTAHGAGLPN